MLRLPFSAPLMTAAGAVAARPDTARIVTAALLSMVPTFEGRYAVAVAIGMGLPAAFAYLLALVCSSVPVPFILLLLRPVLDWFYTLPIKPVRAFAAWLERHTAKKRRAMKRNRKKGIRRYFSAEMAELVGLYLFVALPLPGTGVWTGSAIATLFNMPRGKSAAAILLGNATACLIMTLAAHGVTAVVG